MPKKVLIIIVAAIAIGGIITVVKPHEEKDFVEQNREEIEERVRGYITRYKLDSDKLKIKHIGKPLQLPTGEKVFSIDIEYTGFPYFTMILRGNADTLGMNEPTDHIIVEIFNELYLEERFDEFKPTIDYLRGLGIIDPIRPEDTKVKYFDTSVGLDSEINRDLKRAFNESDETFNKLRQYIRDNIELIKKLDTNIHIIGTKKGIDEQKAGEIQKELMNILPKGMYYVSLGIRDLKTGVPKEGLYKTIEIKRGDGK